ncbi:aminotransferase class III-fold pyridoxal phosphate-dependent enzyme, partial [Pseudoalteromonas sp. MMG022]|uniref:aspartate aminotransferase family protein n=1 Tax=Pseudoalteromonas sp. MMG022 TaxID=2909978 RepID=UPI001F00FEAE
QNDLQDLHYLESEYCSQGDTVHYNKPIQFFKSAYDSYLLDYEDNLYLDFQMAYSAVNFGYRNPLYEEALNEQIKTLPQLASEYVSKEKVILSSLIGKTCQKTFGQKGRVHFNVGGAQSIDDSLKLVSINKGNRNVFAFEGAYHGRTLGASALTSSYRYRKGFGEFGSRALFIPYPYCFRCPYGKKQENCNLYCAKQFKRLFDSEYQTILDTRDKSTEVSAFYIEPVQGTGGYIIPPAGYLEEIATVLKEYNILLVSDEIQMGFYRTGKMWASEHFNITPDILVFGKSMTNGLNPLSGLWATEKLISPDKFPPGSTHSSFGSNPIGCKLGIATFEHINSSSYEKEVSEKGKYLLSELKELQKKHPCIGDVDGLGLALRVEICHEDGLTPNKGLTDQIKHTALKTSIKTDDGDFRLVLDIGGYYKNVLTLAPNLRVTKKQMDNFITIIDRIITSLTKNK